VSGFAVPVVLVAFARADTLALVLASLRQVRPRLLLVVTDGPRATHPGDAAACAAVRAVLQTIDWPCDIRRRQSDRNLGCDASITTGLDWAFRQVDEAIVLEDDVVPDPSFFPWCAAMLRRHRHDPAVMQVSGRNELGRWGHAGVDHLLVRRGSVWGWATWARAWSGVDRTWFAAPDGPKRGGAALDRLILDPLLADHLSVHLGLAASGERPGWDVMWSICRILAGGLSVIPPVNLIANIGFGAGATRTKNGADIRGGLRAGAIPALYDGRSAGIDPHYDRLSLLVELMATYRHPAMARRLAERPQLLPRARPEERAALLHHLAPFAHADESLRVLQHLRSLGASTAESAKIEAALQALPVRRPEVVHA
jgi:hypothetical protein